MQHPIHRVCSFRVVGEYVLGVMFDDGTEQIIDFRPVLAGKLLGPLRDLALLHSCKHVHGESRLTPLSTG